MRYFSRKLLDRSRTPPSLVLKIELFIFLAIFALYPLVKSILLEVHTFSASYKNVLTVINLHILIFLKLCVQYNLKIDLLTRLLYWTQILKKCDFWQVYDD